jgi:hypothetical protein
MAYMAEKARFSDGAPLARLAFRGVREDQAN